MFEEFSKVLKILKIESDGYWVKIGNRILFIKDEFISSKIIDLIKGDDEKIIDLIKGDDDKRIIDLIKGDDDNNVI